MTPVTWPWEADKRLAAKVAHEANRAYCAALGDNTHKSWEDSPDWVKESALKGVEALMQNPDSTPEGLHEKWLQHKKDTGWSFGKVKDPETKTHPCMVPYNELPMEQRVKDHLFRAIVKAVIGSGPTIQDSCG